MNSFIEQIETKMQSGFTLNTEKLASRRASRILKAKKRSSNSEELTSIQNCDEPENQQTSNYSQNSIGYEQGPRIFRFNQAGGDISGQLESNICDERGMEATQAPVLKRQRVCRNLFI